MLTTVASPLGAGSDTRTRLVTAGTAPFGSVSERTRPVSLPLSLTSSCIRCAIVRPRSALRRGIDELRFEVWPLHRHEVPGVGPAERAVHALPLLQRRIGDLDRAKNRLAAYRVKGTETDCDRRTGRGGRSLERDVVKRERAGKFSEL